MKALSRSGARQPCSQRHKSRGVALPCLSLNMLVGDMQESMSGKCVPPPTEWMASKALKAKGTCRMGLHDQHASQHVNQ